MRWNEFMRAKAACAYFFVGPGLAYGLFTSRLPALKAQTGANEAEIGFILLCFGSAGLAGLLLSSPAIRRFGSRTVLRLSSLALVLALPVVSLAPSPFWLGFLVVFAGLSIGFSDVAMNTQAIQLEHRYAAPCMALMHGGYSIGGVAGALGSALFAWAELSPFWNFVTLFGVYACLRPWALPGLQQDRIAVEERSGKRKPFVMPPLFVILCGVIAACCYAAEGTVGEWGSLYLNAVKGAGEGAAALVYASFSVSVVVCRLFTDMARTHFEDFHLLFAGTLLTIFGMCAVLFAERVTLCLAGYACVGFGMAPVVPILFSRAGSCPGVAASTASAVVSVLAYAGLLMFPPLIGTLAHAYGLQHALLVALGLCCLMLVGSFLFKRPARPGK